MQALASAISRLSDFHRELDALECDAGAREQVESMLNERFKEWLNRTGNIRQVTDLMAQPTW